MTPAPSGQWRTMPAGHVVGPGRYRWRGEIIGAFSQARARVMAVAFEAYLKTFMRPKKVWHVIGPKTMTGADSPERTMLYILWES